MKVAVEEVAQVTVVAPSADEGREGGTQVGAGWVEAGNAAVQKVEVQMEEVVR